MADATTIDLLVAAARLVPDTGWMFTGFNWPMLAVRTARRLGKSPTELFESGQAIDEAPDVIPSSTTDYAALAEVTVWRGTTLDALALVSRCEVAMLDASVVDRLGRVNCFGAGPVVHPTFRSAGGGGSADAAARASRLILVHGGDDLTRFAQPLEHLTAVPAATADVIVVTRWGTARLGSAPTVLEVTDGPDADAFVRMVLENGPVEGTPQLRPAVTARERDAATAVLAEAGLRGYRAGLPFIPTEQSAPSRRSP